MLHAPTARQITIETLKELGGDQAPLSESWLVKKGYVVGCRFECGGLSAVWFFDADEATIYDQDGKVLKVVGLTETRSKAA